MSEHGVTRHHVDVLGRSVHYRRSGSGPPVLLLHASPRTSAALLPLMARAPTAVTVLAFDTPGCGDSEPLALTRPDADDYGIAMAETMSALGIDRAAVYGTHTGAAIAMALAVRHPQRVTALVLDGLSVFDATERLWLDDYLPPFVPRVDGSHLAWLWTRVRDAHLFFPWHQRRTGARLWRPMPTPAALHAGALDLLRAGDAYRAPYQAAWLFQPPKWLAQLQMPVLIGARPDDVLAAHLARLAAVPARPAQVRIEPLPADDAGWGERIWSELRRGCAALPATPAAPEATSTLRREGRLGSAIVGPLGARIHVRAALGGSGRPLVLLHDSPGGARGLDIEATTRLRAEGATRPVIVPDWPAHGDSDHWHGALTPGALADALCGALQALGIDEADIEGVGAGSRIAAACAAARPTGLRAPTSTPLGPDAFTVPANPPCASGGHLLAAWLHARDERVMGPVWARASDARHHVVEPIDPDRIHSGCVEFLKEAPGAHEIRRALQLQAGLPHPSSRQRD